MALALVITSCTEQLVVRPEGDFSWEPQGQLIWPIEGAIVGGFQDSVRPSHQGIDLAARSGDPVAAALLGEAGYVGEMSGYGNVVALTHGDELTTVYGHLGETRVVAGERVLRGQTIGTVGPESYLHYEIRKAKRPVDPASLYPTAPRPVVGGSGDVHDAIAQEPPIVGVLGAAVEPPPPPPPPPRATELPRMRPTPPPAIARRDLPPPTRVPTLPPPPPTPTPTLRPPPAPVPTLRPPPPTPTQPERKRAAEPEAADTSDTWNRVGMGAALAGVNLFYVPAKIVYAGLGAVTGAVALVIAHDRDVADTVWTPTLGGDYFVREEHLRGDEALQFLGESEAPAPPPPP